MRSNQLLTWLAFVMALAPLVCAAASYDPVPPGWSRRIDQPGLILVGGEYCTQDGKCHWVGEAMPEAVYPDGTRIAGIQACNMRQQQPECERARMSVQVLAASPGGSFIVRMNGVNYGTTASHLVIQSGGQLVPADRYTPFAGATVPPRAQYGPRQRAFAACIDREAATGKYTSLDGGHSALRMLGACQHSWTDYLDGCVARGNDQGSCGLSAGVIAQAALKLRGL